MRSIACLFATKANVLSFPCLKTKIRFARKPMIALVSALLAAISAGAQNQVIGSYPNMQGGMENGSAALAASTTVAAGTQLAGFTAATSGNSTLAIGTGSARSGTKSLTWTTSSTSGLLWTPSAPSQGIANGTSYVVQFFYNRAASSSRSFDVSISPDGTAQMGAPAVNTGSLSATSFTKASVVVTSGSSANATRYGFVQFKPNGGSFSTGGYIIDDICIYQGTAVDVTAPAAATAAGATIATATSLNVAWTASSAIDGGGYVVVRHNAATAQTLNQNGIYGVGNSAATGGGTVVYVGTGTSFTDASLTTGTTYYYSVFAGDKAFNYAAAATCNGTPYGACTNPTLSGASQAQVVCSGSNASINISGLQASTLHSISYDIAGGSTVVTSATSDASGNATFFVPVTFANNAQTLTVSSMTTGGSCTTNFNSNNTATLSVNDLPLAPTGPVPAARCGSGSVGLSVDDPGAGFTIDWYAASSGGSALSTGSNTYNTGSIAATTTYYAQTRNTSTGCVSSARTAVIATINALPTITPTNVTVAQGSGSANLVYSSSNTPNQYSIGYDGTAQAAGFSNVATTALTASPLSIAVPPAAAAGTYNGTITATVSATGCSSSATAFTVTVVGPYTWTGLAGDGLLASANNWTPQRTTPASSDVLKFDGATVASATVSIGATTTINTLLLVNSASITFTTAALTATNGISIGVGSTLSQTTGSTFTVGGASTIAGTYNLNSGTFVTTGSVVTVTGTFNNASTGTAAITSSSSTMLFSSASGVGTYNLSSVLTGSGTGQVPAATWSTVNGNGTIKITGATTATQIGAVGAPGASGFGNIEFDLPNLTSGGFKVFASGSFGNGMIIAGNLTFGRTNTGLIQMTTGSPSTITIGGNLNVYAGTWNLMPFGGSNGTATMIVGGDVHIDATVAYQGQGYTRPIFNLTSARAGNAGALTVGGSLYLNSGVNIAELAQSLGTATLTFNGSSAKTVSQLNGSVISGTIGVVVNKPSSTLTLASNLAGAGTQNLTLTAGTLNTSTHSLTLNGSLSASAGTIDATAGGIIMKGSGAQSIPANVFSSSTVGSFTMNSGGTTTIASALTVEGAMTLTAGTLSIGSNVLTLKGDVSRGSGTINASLGSVVLHGTGAQSVAAGSFVSGSIKNLTLSNSAGASISDALTIGTTLTLSEGTLSMPGGVSIATGGQVQRLDGALAATPVWLGVADVQYSNTTPITSGAELPAGNTALRNLSMNGGAAVTLGQAARINGTLALSDGILDLSSFNLSVAAGSITGGSAASYVRTSGAGALTVRNVPSTATAFPVGNSTFNPLDIANPVALDWSVRVEDAISNVTPEYGANVAKAVSRQWDITPSQNAPAPGGGATITFYYDGTTDVGGSFNNGANLQLWHYYQGFWAKRGGAVAPGTANGLKTVTVSGLTYFSPYALSNFDAPLPVTLLSFTGKRNGTVNELKWKTASESNSRGFAVERSSDGVTFTQVTFVPSRANGGNSTSDISYAYSDASAGSAGQGAANKWYYRLKQVDLDGQYKYSAVVLLKGDKSGFITVEGIYPNPVKATASIRIQAGSTGGSIVLQLTDMQGRTVRTKTINTEAGAATTIQMDMGGLAAGQYHLKAIAGEEVSETVTVIKN
ncbi:MAG: T9SS type A sorting domain-containing protein [Chitinophagaceae bacterium]|nr:MAG: T9SS type A sorting domain-containing protein [Chitinophagaceae bacterium]